MCLDFIYLLNHSFSQVLISHSRTYSLPYTLIHSFIHLPDQLNSYAISLACFVHHTHVFTHLLTPSNQSTRLLMRSLHLAIYSTYSLVLHNNMAYSCTYLFTSSMLFILFTHSLQHTNFHSLHHEPLIFSSLFSGKVNYFCVLRAAYILILLIKEFVDIVINYTQTPHYVCRD